MTSKIRRNLVSLRCCCEVKKLIKNFEHRSDVQVTYNFCRNSRPICSVTVRFKIILKSLPILNVTATLKVSWKFWSILNFELTFLRFRRCRWFGNCGKLSTSLRGRIEGEDCSNISVHCWCRSGVVSWLKFTINFWAFFALQQSSSYSYSMRVLTGFFYNRYFNCQCEAYYTGCTRGRQ